MSEQKDTNEAACGGSALTAELGADLTIPDFLRNQRNLVAEKEAEIARLREGTEEATEILDSMMASIKAHGHYSVDSTLLFLSQARQCLQVPNA